MRFWKYVKDFTLSFSKKNESQEGQQSQGDSQEESTQQQSIEMNNDSSQQEGQQGQGISQEESTKQQSIEMNNDSSQQEGQQGQGISQEESTQQQSNEMNNDSSQSQEGQQSQGISQEESTQQQSIEMNNDSSQLQEGQQGQGSSQEDSTKQQSNEMNNDSSQQEGQQGQGISQEESTQQQSNEMNNDSSQQEGQQSQGISQEESTQQPSQRGTIENLEEKKENLQQLRNKLFDLKNKKQEIKSEAKEKLNKEKEDEEKKKEEKYELSEQTNNFLNKLNELPSFENRQRNAGYSIDTNGYTDIPDSVIRTLITKFLNQRFCKNSTDLNVRSNSLEKTNGFYKWEVKDVIIHLETHQITKVLTDKYGYQYEQGKNENVPLSVYFDMSGSMSNYTNTLAVIAIELLKKNVKVLVGYNERVNVQIESIKENIDVETLTKVLKSAGYYSGWYGQSSCKKLIKDSRIIFKYINKDLDNYLLSKKAEKCVVFADFDPKDEVINLSRKIQVYWFCFENYYDIDDLEDYKGFIYPVQNIKDIVKGIIKVNDKRFEALCYTDNPKTLQRRFKK